MHLSTIAASSLLLAGSALAKEPLRYRQATVSGAQPSAIPSGTTTGGSTSAGGGVPVWVVKVGNEQGGLVFEPNNIQAKVGDMVQFQFYPKNHSVAMSNFANPCVPIQQSDPTVQSAFWSGFVPTTDMGKLTYTIPVKDTKPVWFYCSQAKHCQEGMVGAINAPATGNTLEAFVGKAKAAPQTISPSGGSSTGNTGSGQIGENTGTNGNPAAQVSQAAAAQPLIEAAKQGSWGVALAGIAAFLAL